MIAKVSFLIFVTILGIFVYQSYFLEKGEMPSEEFMPELDRLISEILLKENDEERSKKIYEDSLLHFLEEQIGTDRSSEAFAERDKNSENEEGIVASISTSKIITDWQTRLEHARVLSYLNRYDEAIAEYQELLRENPEFYDAQIELAQIYYYQKNYSQAMEALTKIPTEKFTPKLTLLVAEISLAEKNYDKAEKIYKDYLAQNPEDDAVRFKLAEMLSWEKRYEDSIYLYEQILKKHPNDIQVRRKYGLVLMWMGKDTQAAEELRKTLR